MEENKKLYESKTVWGGVIVVLATVAGLFGFEVDNTTQAQIVDYILAAVTAVGGLLAIWGRARASKTIK